VSTRTSSRGSQRDAPRSKTRPSRNGTGKSFFRRYWWVFVVVPVVILLALIGTMGFVYANLDIPNTGPGAQTTVVFDRNGKRIASFHAEINRTPIEFDQMPEHLRQAVIAVEDKDFYEHGGIRPLGIIRAAWTNITSGEIEQGGSTITQQYVKNVYTGAERTVTRKIKEAMLAMKVDNKYSKDEILARYLNTVYFGKGAYGVEAAARTYFGRPASKLTLLQSATLAGIIQLPARYDPIDHPEAAMARRNLVLDLMAEQGYITQAEAEELKAKPVTVRRGAATSTSGRFPYFIDYVRREMLSEFGEELTYSGGLQVHTTVESAWQGAAEEAIATNLPDPKGPIGALVAIDPKTGAVRALVGGRNYDKSKFNAAVQARRGAGSAFKTFTLSAAFEQRIDPMSIWNGPSQITIPDKECYTDGEPWMPSNYADAGQGTMTLLQATALSVNTIFAQLVVEVGPESVVDVAHRMGIESELDPVCAITLGSEDVIPMEMANAYATLAARGVRRRPTPFAKVTDADGTVRLRPKGSGTRALEQNDADLVTNALEGVVQSGTGTGADIGRPVAGKTGTGQDYRNAWFCGYTPQLAACVWVGYQKGEIPMEGIYGLSGVTGGSIPASIWNDFMTVAMADLPVEDFPQPDLSGYDRDPTGITPSPAPAPSPSPSPSPSPTVVPSLPLPTGSPSPSPSPTGNEGSPGNESERSVPARRADGYG
jgi:1A family penicillin-binding protein